MTEAEALDMAARAAGWRDWRDAAYFWQTASTETDSICAHAKTLMENAALKAEVERLREALGAALTAIQFVRERDGLMDDEAALEKQARAALKEISNGDR